MTTQRQKEAVHFCEDVLYDVKFDGDINNFKEVSSFLSMYLQEAKDMFDEIKCEYEAYIDELNFDYQ